MAEETPRNPTPNDQLLDASPDGVLAFDRACRYTIWNRAMERISGLRREEVVGRVAFEVFPFLRETGEDKYFYEALAGRDAVSEARAYDVPESGRRGYFDGHYSPLRDSAGRVVGGVAFVRDITARKLAEGALRESEERYRAFIANSSEGIWRFELERPVPASLPADEQIELFYRDGYLAECNDAMARMYGYERAGEIAGARLSDLLVRTDPANVEYLRAFVAAGYRLSEVESVERDREGRTKYFSNSLVGVVEGGHVVRAWGTQRDVTERKRIEDELKATEHRFLMFMEHLPGLAWIKDSDGRYVYVNEAAARAFGATREGVRGKTDEELFPPETAAQFRENDRAALSGGEGVATVETLAQADGVHHSIVSKFPIPGRGGEAAMVGGVAVDVTERMRVEAALRESEERYRSLLENANDIIYSHDLQGNYLAINKACERITGYTRHEILNGLNIAQVVAPDHLELARRMMEQKLSDPSPTVYEIDILTKDRRRLTLEVSTRISYLEGRPAAVEGIARDVTERKRAEEEREQLLARERAARAEAEEASRLKDEFLATLSHELRTPLTAIVGWLHLIRAGRMDEAAVERALDTVERNARSQAQLINDLLDVSRVVTGKLHLDVLPVAVESVVDGAITSVRPAADAKRISIHAALEPLLPPVQGDPDRLQQVFWNLLSNAVKFTPEGGRIDVKVRARAAAVEVEVRDTGQGISREFLPHVFDRFRQADQSTTRAHGGLGLGLSIVRHLVELHGGTVRAESAGAGRGATFAVTLPLVPATQAVGPPVPSGANVDGEPGPNGSPLRLDGLRVLVVDDEPDARELLRVGLSRCGARVSAASTAVEALKALAEELPEVLISDIGMPEADGYELIRQIRSLPAERGGRTPAVALTAYARAEDRQLALDAGYQLHVAKPVELDELVAAVASLTRHAADDTEPDANRRGDE